MNLKKYKTELRDREAVVNGFEFVPVDNSVWVPLGLAFFTFKIRNPQSGQFNFTDVTGIDATAQVVVTIATNVTENGARPSDYVVTIAGFAEVGNDDSLTSWYTLSMTSTGPEFADELTQLGVESKMSTGDILNLFTTLINPEA